MDKLKRLLAFLKSVHIQRYINIFIVGVGLVADVISLGLFFGAINTSPSGSNFYVNSREYLAWILVAIVYSLGLLNALIRRRWKNKYRSGGNNSVLNIFAKFSIMLHGPSLFKENYERDVANWTNFKRDYSFLFIIMFPVVFLLSRAITATENTTSITGSPWGDLIVALLNTIWITFIMMIITSMFEFAMSMFVGDVNPIE